MAYSISAEWTAPRMACPSRSHTYAYVVADGLQVPFFAAIRWPDRTVPASAGRTVFRSAAPRATVTPGLVAVVRPVLLAAVGRQATLCR